MALCLEEREESTDVFSAEDLSPWKKRKGEEGRKSQRHNTFLIAPAEQSHRPPLYPTEWRPDSHRRPGQHWAAALHSPCSPEMTKHYHHFMSDHYESHFLVSREIFYAVKRGRRKSCWDMQVGYLGHALRAASSIVLFPSSLFFTSCDFARMNIGATFKEAIYRKRNAI